MVKLTNIDQLESWIDMGALTAVNFDKAIDDTTRIVLYFMGGQVLYILDNEENRKELEHYIHLSERQ